MALFYYPLNNKIMKADNQKPEKGNRPDEIPEKHQSEQEGSGYAPQREQQQHNKGNDASYSEQNDVTPPNQKEFPVTGPGKADFESRPQARRTSRMVGHEPGTESI
ncbi:MAG: hypothetical protein JWQ06_1728 [Mucilaginibacter sp.]|nr:hypothetical protein [Mucilaginibacter sp.]